MRVCGVCTAVYTWFVYVREILCLWYVCEHAFMIVYVNTCVVCEPMCVCSMCVIVYVSVYGMCIIVYVNMYGVCVIIYVSI